MRKLKFPSTLFFALIALAVFLDFATTQIGLSLGFRESGKALFLAEALGLLFFTFVFWKLGSRISRVAGYACTVPIVAAGYAPFLHNMLVLGGLL